MRSQLHTLARTLRPHIVAWGPVAVAALYCIAWGVAEAGRWFGSTPLMLVLFAAAIGLSGRFPSIALGVAVGIPALQLIGVLEPPTANNWFMYNGVGAVAFIVAFRATGWTRRLALPVGVVVSVLFAARLVMDGEDGSSWTDWVGGADAFRLNPEYPVREDFVVLLVGAIIFYVACWALGTAARALLSERALGGVLVAAEHRLEETDFELRLSQDRARISRDVHDTLAHSLAVIVSQAEGAIALSATKPVVAAEALANIATVGRAALVDVRSLVESIHEHDITAAKPTIDLPSVVEHLRSVGMDVSFRVLGTPRALTPSHDLGVFRIVQESLTNALRHGGQNSTATVTLDWQGTGLAVLVASSGTPTETPPAASRGVGIEGMKERARLMGGWLTAEPADDGTFLVTAFVPVARPARMELADA